MLAAVDVLLSAYTTLLIPVTVLSRMLLAHRMCVCGTCGLIHILGKHAAVDLLASQH
jgi:hypothetical protein